MIRITIIFTIMLASSLMWAAGGTVIDPNGVAPDRYAYYPGTEALAEDEIRVVACGTGMPAARRGQAATCFLVEVGNGEKFIFDIGSGSMANLAALMIPYQYLDKLFLTHLHTPISPALCPPMYARCFAGVSVLSAGWLCPATRKIFIRPMRK